MNIRSTPAQGAGFSVARVCALAAIFVALCLAAPSGALASGKDVIRDCTDDGQLGKGYSQKEYRDALAKLPTDVDEYTDCRDVIRHAQLGGAGGSRDDDSGSGTSGGFGGSGGGTTATADSTKEKDDLAKARSGDQSPVTVGGRTVTPGAGRFTSSSVRNSLPTPILVALIMLGAGVLAGGGWAARRRVFPRRTA